MKWRIFLQRRIYRGQSRRWADTTTLSRQTSSFLSYFNHLYVVLHAIMSLTNTVFSTLDKMYSFWWFCMFVSTRSTHWCRVFLTRMEALRGKSSPKSTLSHSWLHFATAMEAKGARKACLRGIAARLQSGEEGCERTDGDMGPPNALPFKMWSCTLSFHRIPSAPLIWQSGVHARSRE